ncbi:TlpA family protein disulfide reductase [Paenibacillus cymbidii]|uniref:TlpA family protein disulfide reductase n=1 Tax=Paenibacillus cymbidii TaxID=1639034 RepID=UPI0014368B4C|nr:TlpA disulfide reductase family protein [Paenibacillus cymbidii]
MGGVQIGSLTLNGSLLVYLLFGVAGWLVLRFGAGQEQEQEQGQGPIRSEERQWLLARAGTAFWLWLVLWKGSFLLFHPAATLRQPSSLLYFDGGERGVWLATLVVAIYIAVMLRRGGMPLRTVAFGALQFMLGGWAASRLLLLAFGAQPQWLHGAAAAASLLLLAALPALRRKLDGGGASPYGLPAAAAVVLAALLAFGRLEEALPGRMATPPVGDGAVSAAKLGQPAPDFALEGADGQPIRLADYRGRTVVLNFWATWCPPCRAEMPQMQTFHEQAAASGSGVVVLAVNLTSTESGADKPRQFAQKRGLTFPVALDAAGDVQRAYRVTAYPTTFVVDPQGVVRTVWKGAMSADSLQAAVDKL